MCFKYYGTRVLCFQSGKDRGLCVLVLRSESCAFKLARTAVMCSNKTEREFSAFTVTKTVGYVSHILRNDSSVLSS